MYNARGSRSDRARGLRRRWKIVKRGEIRSRALFAKNPKSARRKSSAGPVDPPRTEIAEHYNANAVTCLSPKINNTLVRRISPARNHDRRRSLEKKKNLKNKNRPNIMYGRRRNLLSVRRKYPLASRPAHTYVREWRINVHANRWPYKADRCILRFMQMRVCFDVCIWLCILIDSETAENEKTVYRIL